MTTTPKRSPPASELLSHKTSTISCDQALRIARTDAESAYRDLSLYRISIVLEQDGWQVDYELKDANLHGGGPHYVIDSKSASRRCTVSVDRCEMRTSPARFSIRSKRSEFTRTVKLSSGFSIFDF